MLNEFNLIGATFKKLVCDGEYRSQFTDNYMPTIEIMKDGRIFIESKYLSTVNGHLKLVKYVVVDADGKLTSDSSQGYIELLDHGYIIRLEVSRPFSENTMEVAYIVNLNEVFVYPIYQEGEAPVFQFHTVPLYDEGGIPIMDNKTIELIENKEEFYKRYIQNHTASYM